MRRYPAGEFGIYDDQGLPIWRLCKIWESLNPAERFPFLLCLEPTIADQLIEQTYTPATPVEQETEHAEKT